MQFSLITPEKILFSAEAKMVTAPGREGEFGVLPGHAPFISSLQAGIVTVDTVGGERQTFEISGGFAEVTPGYCTVLAST